MQRILIVQTAFIGDVILITPLIKAVKEIFPDSSIDALVIPQTKSVLENNPDIRKIITFDKRENKLIAFSRTLKIIRQNHYSLCIIPHSSFTTALLTYFAGIKKRIGFDRWLAKYFLTDRLPFSKNILRIQKNLSLLKPLSEKDFSLQTHLYPNSADILKVETELDSLSRFIAIAPGSVWASKRWPKEYFIVLTQSLVKQGHSLVFTGSTQERELCEEIIQSAGIKAINFAGDMTLLQTAAIFQKAELVLSNDSGALHIANAMQTPVFAFFGPTVQSLGYYPFQPKDLVLETDIPCRPCGSHGGNVCPLKHFKCMRNITPDIVLEKIKTFLKKTESF